jgi:hypothetical protein
MPIFVIITIIATCAFGSLAHADEPAVAAAPARSRRSPALETSSEFQREAWNYNLSDEDLFGGTATLWYPLGRNWSIGGEMLVLWVHQEPVPSTPLAGVALVGRRHFQRANLSYFVEGGGGMSYAARFVPNRGTRFNYVAEVAAGVVHATSRYAHLVASFRFLHVSNNSLAGHSRNPDIEAFGIRIGMLLPLSP